MKDCLLLTDVADQAGVTPAQLRALLRGPWADRIPRTRAKAGKRFHPEAVAVVRELRAHGCVPLTQTKLMQAIGRRKPHVRVGRSLLRITWASAEDLRRDHRGHVVPVVLDAQRIELRVLPPFGTPDERRRFDDMFRGDE